MIGALLKLPVFTALKGQVLAAVLGALLLVIVGEGAAVLVYRGMYHHEVKIAAKLKDDVTLAEGNLKTVREIADGNHQANLDLAGKLLVCVQENARVAGENQAAVQAADARIASERAKGEAWRTMFNNASKKPACSLILDKDFMAACGIRDY